MLLQFLIKTTEMTHCFFYNLESYLYVKFKCIFQYVKHLYLHILMYLIFKTYILFEVNSNSNATCIRITVHFIQEHFN